jgi:uncharacterized protein YidB (DUF937 family)
MGLLDGIFGKAGSTSQQSSGPLCDLLGGLGGEDGYDLVTAAMSLLQQYGGLSGVLDLLRRKGLGQEAESWVDTGPNMAVSGEQLEQAFGRSTIGDIASQLGTSQGETSSALARILPDLVDRLTPDGHIPDNHNDLISQSLAILRGDDA